MNQLLTEQLKFHGQKRTNERAIYFVEGVGKIKSMLTYGQLYAQSVAIAKKLMREHSDDRHILIMYGHEIEFITAFLGTLLAGKIAVPAYPPTTKRMAARLNHMIEDSGCSLLLTSSAVMQKLNTLQGVSCANKLLANSTRDKSMSSTVKKKTGVAADINLFALESVITTDLGASNTNDFMPPRLDSEDIAFLQYTSGSTDNPKGVMVSHGNLVNNFANMHSLYQLKEHDRCFSWLPLNHDMGLIGMTLCPIYFGVPVYMMPPIDFIKSPLNWLKNIEHFQITLTGGPNFAYELCAKRLKHFRGKMNLGSCRVFYSGAECIRPSTVNAFYRAIERHNGSPRQQLNVYGLAEATLISTAGVLGQNLEHEGRISCGRPGDGQIIKIVDPETLVEKKHGEIGEIWLQGPSVTKGYWKKQALNQAVFQARLKGAEHLGGFLRTGDTGYLYQGNLYITGRVKDVIIVRGKNYFSEDIEWSLKQVNPLLRDGGSAAIAVEHEGGENLVIISEVKNISLNLADLKSLYQAVNQRIYEDHFIHADRLVLIKGRTLPKTTSGKIRRSYCKRLLEHGGLEIVEDISY